MDSDNSTADPGQRNLLKKHKGGTLKAPYQFNVPKAPEDLYMQKLDDFCITGPPGDDDDRVDYYITSRQDDESDDREPIILVEAVGSIN